MSKASEKKNKLSLFYICFISLFLLAITITFLVTGYLGSATLVGALLGIWFAWRLNLDSVEKRRQDEYRSLLVSFAHELVECFHRCVLYHRQQQSDDISFSAIFNFNDAATLSRLASVTDNPKIVDAIMYLKKIYFQVGRHVENASKFATEFQFIKSKIFKTQKVTSEERSQMQMFEIKASDAQGTALAFFKGSSNDNDTYPKIVDSTELLINELTKKWSDDEVKGLEDTFSKDREELRDLEDQKRQQKTSTLPPGGEKMGKDPTRSLQMEIINRRLYERIQTWNYWIDHSIKYLLYVNAGGVIAMLTFMGILNIAEVISWAGLALAFFILGLALVGVVLASLYYMFRKSSKALSADRQKFVDEKMTFQELLDNDSPRMKENTFSVILSWISAGCILGGIVFGFISFFTYN